MDEDISRMIFLKNHDSADQTLVKCSCQPYTQQMSKSSVIHSHKIETEVYDWIKAASKLVEYVRPLPAIRVQTTPAAQPPGAQPELHA